MGLAQNEMKAKPDLPERVLSNEGLGAALAKRLWLMGGAHAALRIKTALDLVERAFDSYYNKKCQLCRRYAQRLARKEASHSCNSCEVKTVSGECGCRLHGCHSKGKTLQQRFRLQG